MKRIGNNLIVSGIILLLLQNQSFLLFLKFLFKQMQSDWPIVLVVIGYMMRCKKKKRKTQR